jgi:hypothetical protein
MESVRPQVATTRGPSHSPGFFVCVALQEGSGMGEWGAGNGRGTIRHSRLHSRLLIQMLRFGKLAPVDSPTDELSGGISPE